MIMMMPNDDAARRVWRDTNDFLRFTLTFSTFLWLAHLFFFPFPIFSSCVEMSFYCYFADKWLPTFGGSITMIDRLHDDDGLQKPILCASK